MKNAYEGYVFALPDGWHVIYRNVIVGATWAMRGPAEAHLDLLRSGYYERPGLVKVSLA